MAQPTNMFFTKGPNSTAQLSRGTNLSYQSTNVAIYTSTQIDQWAIGDFISAEYIINAEYGLNERETINVTLVAMPGQTTVNIHGRTSLTRQLLNVRSNAANSYAQLIVEPASTQVQGIIVSFFAIYAKASQPLVPINSPAVANNCSWSTTTGTSLTITVNGELQGNILVGQIVENNYIPSLAKVTSWNPVTKILILGGFTSQTVSAQTTQQLQFILGISEVTNTVVAQPTPGFSTVSVSGQPSINSSSLSKNLNVVVGTGLTATAQASTNTLTITNQALTQVAVRGQTTINSVTSGIPTLNLVAGGNIVLTTNAANNQVTIASQGISTTTSDSITTTSNSFGIYGTGGVTTSTSNGNIIINTPTYNVYSTFTDNNGNTSSATLANSSFKIVAGNGISAVVTAQAPTYGDSLVVTNTGVTSIGGTTGDITSNSLVNIINSSAGSVNLPVGQITQNSGQFTNLSVSASATFASSVTMSSTLTVSGLTTFGPMLEQINVTNSGTVGNLTINVLSGGITYFNQISTGNFTLNITGGSNISLNSLMNIGQSVSVVILNQNGGTGYYALTYFIDNVTIIPKWLGGTAPSSGNANSIDAYTLTIVKTGVSVFTVLAGLSKYA